jgi:ribosome-associated protein
VVEALSDKQASNIVLLNTSAISDFADYFVICSADTSRQINAIRDEVEHLLKREGILPHHREGTVDSGWLLLDYGDVVVHIFASPEREFYQLDKLWNQANTLIQIQ